MVSNTAYTPNQLIALNLARARNERGWTQEETARRLRPYLGSRWSVASLSAIERSVMGSRIKQFSADELFAIARTFDLPIGWFFSPPPNEPHVRYAAPDSPVGHSFRILVEALLGTEAGRTAFEQNMLSWAATQIGSFDTDEVMSSITQDRDLRTRQRLYAAFGDIEEVKEVLTRLLTALGQVGVDYRPSELREKLDHDQIMEEWLAGQDKGEDPRES